MNTDYRQPDERKHEPTETVPSGPLPLAGATRSDAYDPVQCLRDEVVRFKATNRFTPMEVTGFYIQAAVVLTYVGELEAALRDVLNLTVSDGAKKIVQVTTAAEKALWPNRELRDGDQRQ